MLVYYIENNVCPCMLIPITAPAENTSILYSCWSSPSLSSSSYPCLLHLEQCVPMHADTYRCACREHFKEESGRCKEFTTLHEEIEGVKYWPWQTDVTQHGQTCTWIYCVRCMAWGLAMVYEERISYYDIQGWCMAQECLDPQRILVNEAQMFSLWKVLI